MGQAAQRQVCIGMQKVAVCTGSLAAVKLQTMSGCCYVRCSPPTSCPPGHALLYPRPAGALLCPGTCWPGTCSQEAPRPFKGHAGCIQRICTIIMESQQLEKQCTCCCSYGSTCWLGAVACPHRRARTLRPEHNGTPGRLYRTGLPHLRMLRDSNRGKPRSESSSTGICRAQPACELSTRTVFSGRGVCADLSHKI